LVRFFFEAEMNGLSIDYLKHRLSNHYQVLLKNFKKIFGCNEKGSTFAAAFEKEQFFETGAKNFFKKSLLY